MNDDKGSMRPHGTQDALERRRRKAVALKEQGLRTCEIARRLRTTDRSVRRWLQEQAQGGQAALAAKPVPGRPPKLSARQRRGLVHCLLRGASHYGFGTDLWTCPRIARLIQERYGVPYHVDAIPRVMAGLGFSPSEAPVSGQGAGRRGYSPVDRA